VIRLHYRIKQPPANAAAYIMRVLRGPCKSLIVGQKEEREWAADSENPG